MVEKSQKGCLLLHGLTGMPSNMAPIREALEAKGYIVKNPMLAGHGVDLKTLTQSHWKEWYETARFNYEALSKEAEQIYCVGLSMGALLALKLAEDFGDAIKGLALLGIPLKLRPLFRSLVIPLVRYTPLRFFIRSTPKNFSKSVLDPEGRILYQQGSFTHMPACAVFQCEDLKCEVTKNLHKISQPLLFIHGRKDHLSDASGLLEIKRKIGSQNIKIVMLDNSAHVVTLDYDREEVAKRVVEFFESQIDS